MTDKTSEASGPEWLKLARAEIGTHEASGSQDNPRVLKFYADAGHREIKHDSVPWCAAFVGAMLERSGTPSAKSLSARDYLNWGKKLDKPQLGCVCVFSRGDAHGWQGHVGFYAGEDHLSDTILLLGGNQSDQVSITKQSKKRLLGYRWPVTATNSRTYKAVAVNTVGAAAAAAPAVATIGGEFKALGEYGMMFAVVGAALCVLASVAIIWARVSDLQKKGR